MAGLEETAAAVGEPERLRALEDYGVLDTPAEQDFDDLSALVAELCDTPVALVSFVAADRQWFKARVGFEPSQTDLKRSVCRYVVAERDVLVIPDLADDARTADNPLVTGEPFIRFYAGAPLQTPDGHVLGSLCAIDTKPRPEGLSPKQIESLRRLARQVVDQLELRRMVRQRDGAIVDLARSETYWRRLFEELREGFVLARAVRDTDGRIIDWSCVEVNSAWGELVGIVAKTAVGQTIREMLPSVEQEWVDLANVVDTGETITFTRQVGQLGRWYDGRASAIGEDLFTILFLEVTERVRTDQALAEANARRAALTELADCLRTTMDRKAMSHVAATIMARTLRAGRAGYGVVDLGREVLTVLSDVCTPGTPSIVGEHAFRDYGTFIDDLRQGRMVVVSDVANDPRTCTEVEAFRALGIGAFVNAPVIEHGQLTALTLVHFPEPRVITTEEQAFVRSVADRTQVAIARLRAEEQQAVLNGEISHRLKNVLSMVQAVASQTLKGRAEPQAIQTFAERLAALSKAQDTLLSSEWRSADLESIVRSALNLLGAQGRFDTDGPPVLLGSRATLSTSLLIHELATNALKYGALSRPEGRVVIAWRIEGVDGDADLTLSWREVGGPPAVEPTRRGVGSRLLRSGLVGTGGSDLSFGQDGFAASFRASLREVEQA